MGAEASAYEILGLRPGADRAAIDEAYRRLIKLHHPDRSGGDAGRAAEINRAYLELRGKRAADEPHQPAAGDIGEAIYARRAARKRVDQPAARRRRLWPFLLVAGAVLLVAERDRVADNLLDVQDRVTGGWRPSVSGSPAPERRAASAAIEAALADAEIRSAVARARRLVTRSGDGLAAESRECHRRMRAEPSVAQLDRCAAFDYAAAILEDRDPVEDEGPFSASAVTARQMAAASLLTNDFLAIELRLDQVRSRVEMALAPAPSPLPAAPVYESGPAEPAS